MQSMVLILEMRKLSYRMLNELSKLIFPNLVLCTWRIDPSLMIYISVF